MGGRGVARPGAAAPAAVAPGAREEGFRLESRGPLDFAAIIRLTPDLIEEIRRAEAQGSAARIKFDANANNLAGNVIDVGGKEFRFTWSRELGDLCDIYEERRNGEDGHGVLVECGSAWRKLNVQRVLDESTKNHVKMRSEEAERQLKSRKAIVLDPANPSVKNQAKTMAAAAVEGSMRRMSWKQKKEPFFKKRKVEPNLVPNAGPPKSVSKSATSLKNSTKSMPLVSPVPSPPEQLGVGTSNLALDTGSSPKGDTEPDEAIASLVANKEGTGNFEKDMASVEVHGTMREDIVHKRGIDNKPTDLKGMITMLLSENPKGMNLKALEKAVGETFPNSGKRIESILKNIANFQAPGRYFLKPEVVSESSKGQTFESGSSQENAHITLSVAESLFGEKATIENFEQQTQLTSQVEEESDPFERIFNTQNSPDNFTDDQKVNNENEGRVCSSSESGSDSESESDSSDTGSDSRSPSRSRSKSRSESASSSDSESDGSSSSKEGSDVDVDIMTSDDEKANADQKIEAIDLKFSSPREWRSYDNEHGKNDITKRNQDDQAEPASQYMDEFENDDEITHRMEVPISNGIKDSETLEARIDRSPKVDPFGTSCGFPEEGMSFLPEQHKPTEGRQVSYPRSPVNDCSQQLVKQNEKQTNLSIHQQLDSSKRISKGKPKRASDSDYFEERLESAKRSKVVSSAPATSFGKNRDGAVTGYLNSSPNLTKKDLYKDHSVQAADDVERSGQPIGDKGGKKKAAGSMEKTKYAESISRGNKLAEELSVNPDVSDTFAAKNMSTHERYSMPKNKLQKDMQDENGKSNEKYSAKNGKESIVGGKGLINSDPYNRKSGEHCAVSKDSIQPSQLRKFDMENSLPLSGKASVLRRELSDLELGELRDPPAEDEELGNKRQFEGKGSFKSLENKVVAPNNADMDVNKGRSVANASHELKKQSSPNLRGGTLGNLDESRRRMPENDLADSARPQQRTLLTHSQPFSRAHSDTEDACHLDKSAEMVNRTERKPSEGMGLESHAAAHKKPPASMLPQHDNRHGGQMGFKTVKESQPQKLNETRDSMDHRNGSLWLDNHSNGGRRESSSDEDNSLYSKYDKDEPELKGPIKDYLQYKEYVHEYREKYDHYCSLNTSLENMRNDFLKVGHELELAKGTELEEYYTILEQLKQMYHQHGAKHKQMKKIFILLHEELKNLKQKIKDFASTYAKQ